MRTLCWEIDWTFRLGTTSSNPGNHRAESTMSLRGSLYAGVDENGRKYHKYKEGSKFCCSCRPCRLTDDVNRLYLTERRCKTVVETKGKRISNTVIDGA